MSIEWTAEVRDVRGTELNWLQDVVHTTAREKGWWDTPRSDAECIALMHSELSEALEALRAGDPPDDKVTDMPGSIVELADTVIRILDYCGHRGINLSDAIYKKVAYNKNRPHKHGGKKF